MPNAVVKAILYESTKRSFVVARRNILLYGFTFKENCPDIRNSKALDLYYEFQELGCSVCIVDPLADIALAKSKYDIDIHRTTPDLDFACVVVVVNHSLFETYPRSHWLSFKENGTFLADIKSSIIPRDLVDFRL